MGVLIIIFILGAIGSVIFVVMYQKSKSKDYIERIRSKFNKYDYNPSYNVLLIYNDNSKELYKKMVGQDVKETIKYKMLQTKTGLLFFVSEENAYQILKLIDYECLGCIKLLYEDILKFKLVGQKHYITNVESKVNVGGAFLGGVLAGGVGALLGGKKINSSAKEIDDRIVKIYYKKNNIIKVIDVYFEAYDCLNTILPEKET